MTFAEWVASVKALGGVPTTLPANVPDMMQPYVGAPAARYTNAVYVARSNDGQIDPNAPTVAANNGAYVYVVASEDITGIPHTMTTAERIENAVFSTGDAAASAVGLDKFTSFLGDIGKQIVVGAAVAIGVAVLLKRKR